MPWTWRIKELAHTAAAIAAAVFFSFAAVAAIRLPKMLLHIDGSIMRFEAIESKTNATLDNLDQATKVWAGSAQDQAAAVQGIASKVNATVEQANAVLATTQGTVSAIGDQAKQLGPMIATIRETTATIPATMKAIDETLASSRETMAAGAQTLNTLNARMNDPHVAQLMAHLAATADNGEKMSADAQLKFHAILFPPPCRGSMCWAAKTYRVVKVASSFMEPGYFLEQAIKDR